MIDPLLYSRANAIDRSQPILKIIRDAPLEFRFRSDTVALTIECLIKAIEARTMDTAIPDYKIPAGVDRSNLPKYEGERHQVELKQEAVRIAALRHDMTQGFVLTQYFYEQLIQFERDPASLRDTMGEMVYSMDVDQQVSRAKRIQFDTEADADVLSRPKPHKLEGLDLAEAKLQTGDPAGAASLARPFLSDRHADALQATADAARANFVLARVALINKNPEEAAGRFKTTIDTSKDPRLLAWSHIYLGRMLDLSCRRDEAVAEYKEALENRDGQQDTRVAAERGVKTAYAPIKGHSCEDDDDTDPKADPKVPTTPKPAAPKPQ
jgi:tetratricopeptide (TPR) repeat protein